MTSGISPAGRYFGLALRFTLAFQDFSAQIHEHTLEIQLASLDSPGYHQLYVQEHETLARELEYLDRSGVGEYDDPENIAAEIREQADREAALECAEAELASPEDVEIGGPEVEAQIGEIKELQAEHEAAREALQKQFDEKQQEQCEKQEKLQKDYFEGHPDQTDAERLRDEKKFEGAKLHNKEDLIAKQQAQMGELVQKQQAELQQLERSQLAQDQRDTQVQKQFEQNKDDILQR